MNTTKSILAVLAGGCLLAASARSHAGEVMLKGAQVGQWTMDFDAAAKLAEEKKLPMMLNFTGSDWCGWCKLMEEGVFADNQWKNFASENVVLVTLDFPRDKTIVPEKYVERNNALKDQFGVRGYPTYIILDSDGETKIGQLGAGQDKTPASFIEEFKGTVRLSDTSIAAYVEANPEKADAYKQAVAEMKAAEKELEDWIATQPERNEENIEKFNALQKQIKEANEALNEF
ncbi:MAG: thioredoxin family protein [Verrucomicrobiota bacterium]